MDEPPLPQLNDIACELSLNELSSAASSEADYVQAPLVCAVLPAQSLLYHTNMAHNFFQQQQFNLHFQSTQSLFPVETSEIWSGSTQWQSCMATTSSSLPEHEINAPLPATLSSSIRQAYVPLAKRPSIAGSIPSTISDGEEQVTPDSAADLRRERRRAQNRAAQRAFRARKEETIQESSNRLDTLQAELTHLQANNATLSSTISTLRERIARLQRENTQLKRNSTVNIDTDGDYAGFDLSAVDMGSETVSPALVLPPLKTEDSHDSGVYDMSTTSSTQQPESPRVESGDAAEATNGSGSSAAVVRRGDR